MILNAGHTPLSEEIVSFINGPARALWQEINTFIQERYQVSPKIAYSKCAAKPGWNVKYNKSGKSLCTLYPEEQSFTTLVVIKLEQELVIESMSQQFETEILEIMRSAKPLNGTKWLMIPVTEKRVLDNVKQLLFLKHQGNTSKKNLACKTQKKTKKQVEASG